MMAVPTTAVIEPYAGTIIRRSGYRLVGCASAKELHLG
jgi:hypothetical protein